MIKIQIKFYLSIIFQFKLRLLPTMKPQNNFLENFNENKLTESVKLADYRNSTKQIPHHFIRDSNAPMSQQDRGEEMSEKSEKMIQMGSGERSYIENMKQIKTQYSQHSGGDRPFRKIKGYQVQMLNQLRNEYEVLRNLQAEDSQRNGQKHLIESESNQSFSREQRQSTEKSIKSYQKDINYREEKLWNIQRKQYELIISNCQQKIQELLHAEMEYKKVIYELKNMPTTKTGIKELSQNTQNLRQQQRTERQSRDKIFTLETQVEKVRSYNKELNQRIVKLQDQLTIRDQDATRLEEEKKKLQDLIRLEKDKYMTNEIEKKKIQMEYEILQRDKGYQINRLLRQLQHRQAVAQQDLKMIIKRLEEEIEIKDRRYSLLLEQLENKKKQIEEKEKEEREKQKFKEEIKPKQNQNLALEAFTKFLTEGKVKNNNEQLLKTMNTILQILQKSEKKEPKGNTMENQRLLGEIRLLKAQIQTLRHTKNQNFDLEPIKRAYEGQINNLKQNIYTLEEKLRKAKREPEYSADLLKSPSDSSSKSMQIFRLIKKIQELESILNEKEIIIKEYEDYEMKVKMREEKTENEVRSLKRRGDELEFELEKSRRQSEFNLNMARRENQTVLKIKQAELTKVNQGLQYWKAEFEKVKRFYEQKIAEKNKIIEQTESAEVEEIQKQYEEQLQSAKQDYERQINQLVEKLSQYYSDQGTSETWKKKCLALENSLYDLKKYTQKSKHLNEGIDHLWGIKEAEYHNIHSILKNVHPQSQF